MNESDNELFELCKEVYKRFPNWKYGVDWMQVVNPGLASQYINRVCYDPTDDEDDFLYEREEMDSVPLYTSDYILEKLPAYKTELPDYEERLTLVKEAQKYNASYGYLYRVEAYTPLKALLKLVLALHDAGELKL